MYSSANAALWAESTAVLEEEVSENAYRLVRKPPKKGSSSSSSEARGERGKRLESMSTSSIALGLSNVDALAFPSIIPGVN